MAHKANSIMDIPDSQLHDIGLSIRGLISMLAIIPVKVINSDPKMLFNQPRFGVLYGSMYFPILSFMFFV